MQQTKLCLIGCGAHAQSVYAPTLKRIAAENDLIVLAACCDVDESRAAQMANAAGFVRTYESYTVMLEAERPDAVIAVLPHYLSEGIAVSILELGYPLLLEKPPGDSLSACRNIVAAAEKNGIINQIAYNRHFIPLIRSLYNELHSRTENRPIQNIDYCMYRVHRPEPFFYVTAIHGVDMVGFLANSRYKDVYFRYQMLPQLGDNHYNIFMDCTFESGATAQLRFFVMSGMINERLVITRDDESYCCNIPIWHGCDTPGFLSLYREDKQVMYLSGNDVSDGDNLFESNGFYAEVCTFINAVRTKTQPREAISSSLQCMEIAEHIKKRLPEYHL